MPNSELYAGDLVSKHSDPTNVNYLLRPNDGEITTTNGYFRTPDICNIQLNKTYHVAMVYDGSTLKFYRNGFLMSQVNATGNLFQNNFITRIGSHQGGGFSEDFLGYINEVRIWNVARTQAQIQTYMNTSLPSPTTQTGLQAYYQFDNLTNKQGNTAYNGTFAPLGATTINETNPTCPDFVADYCANTNIPCTAFLKTAATGRSGATIGDLDITRNQLTVEAVFNMTATNVNFFGGDLVSKHTNPATSNYLLRPFRGEIKTNNGFYATTPCNGGIDLNKTYHVAMVYDGSTLTFYNDGYEISSVAASGQLIQNNFVTAIGAIADASNTSPENFRGFIAEVRIWNVARTAEQIRSYVSQVLPNPTSQPGLKAYYTFNSLTNKQGTATYNGTLIGGATINQNNTEFCSNGVDQNCCNCTRISYVLTSLKKSASNQQNSNSKLQLYPNPAKSFVMVIHSASNSTGQLQLIDIAGKTVKTISVPASERITRLMLPQLVPGSYNVIWISDKKREQQTLLIE